MQVLSISWIILNTKDVVLQGDGQIIYKKAPALYIQRGEEKT